MTRLQHAHPLHEPPYTYGRLVVEFLVFVAGLTLIVALMSVGP